MATADVAKFLATDKVPETLFGIPVVQDVRQYTKKDIDFFQMHPEAGGYYDLGDGTPEDGSPEGAPVQADEPRGKVAQNEEQAAPKPTAWDREQLMKLRWKKLMSDPEVSKDIGTVFKTMSGEAALRQNGVSPDVISNGHRARLVVHMNDAADKTNNPANGGRQFSALDMMKRHSYVLTKYPNGGGPATNFFDVAKGAPKFKEIARSPSETDVAMKLMDLSEAFLKGTLSTNGIPAEAVSYGNGARALTSDRQPIQKNAIGVELPETLVLGKKVPKAKPKKK